MAVLLHTPQEATSFSATQHREGRRVAFVPTMGFLHEGHLALMREGRKRADVVVVSIFVNPTQFGPKEDFGRYPRDFDGDRQKCESVGVDAIFVPTVEGMYPPGHQSFVEVGDVSQGLCGEKRPGHFRGVATVVSKLFNIVRPDVALFGEKDFQQLAVIRTMARDLNMGVDVVGLPTVREADGLAMSSRNTYLSGEERKRALSLSRALELARRAFRDGETDAATLEARMGDALLAADVKLDYVALVDSETLRPVRTLRNGANVRALVAGFVGKTRLIDNLPLSEGA